MLPEDIRSLEHLREVHSEKIARIMHPEAERSFREFAEAMTRGNRDGEKVQATRKSEHAERFVDLLLEFDQERARRVAEWSRIVERIDRAIAEHEQYLSFSRALRWIYDAPPPERSSKNRIVAAGLE